MEKQEIFCNRSAAAFKLSTFRIITLAGMGSRNGDGLRRAFTVIIVDTACGITIHINVMARMLHGVSCGITGPFPEAGTAGSGRLFCISSLHHDIAFAAALVLIVHTGLRRTF